MVQFLVVTKHIEQVVLVKLLDFHMTLKDKEILYIDEHLMKKWRTTDSS